jgi:hypothetical protein
MSTTQEDLVTVAGAAHIMNALADENGERANRQEQIETVSAADGSGEVRANQCRGARGCRRA